jgi:hypothetical protein
VRWALDLLPCLAGFSARAMFASMRRQPVDSGRGGLLPLKEKR